MWHDWLGHTGQLIVVEGTDVMERQLHPFLHAGCGIALEADEP